MSFTGRPSRPPLALMSSSQTCIATSDILPLAASGPVSAMPKPILIGSAVCDWAGTAVNKSAAAAADSSTPLILSHRDVIDIFIPGGSQSGGLRKMAAAAANANGGADVRICEISKTRRSSRNVRQAIVYMSALGQKRTLRLISAKTEKPPRGGLSRIRHQTIIAPAA